jgi:agmatine deiminase
MGTPREDGFRMPAEWERHTRCWMAWPCREAIWGNGIEAARQAFADVAEAISEFEPVTMIARPDLTASVSLYTGKSVSVLPMPQDDSWTRDTGPTFLTDGQGNLGGVAWRFNGWGENVTDYAQDARMAARILEHVNARAFASSLVTEGGSLHVDGEGTGLVCEAAMLDPARNPGLTKAEVEAELKEMLGLETVVWLPAGLEDDETRGHVDNIACFARPGVVLAASCDDTTDANHSVLSVNLDILRAATDAKGRQLEVLPLPLPKRRDRKDGRRLTLSYVNFYIANGGVVMPSFADSADKAAYKTVSAAFPDREVVQVEVSELLVGGGGIHCITQQQPAV